MGRKSRREPDSGFIRTWQDAEHLAARAMRQWGYADAKASPGGADRGIDVRAAGALGQVKHHAARVGRPDIQRFIGATFDQSRSQLFFFSAGGYSAAAIEEATRRKIALFIYSVEGTMTTVNDPAREVIDRAKKKRPRSAQSVSPKTTVWGRVEGVDRRLEDWRRGHAGADGSGIIGGATDGSPQQTDSVVRRTGNWRDVHRSERQMTERQAERQMAFVGRNWRWILGFFLLVMSIANLFGNDQVAARAAIGEIGALIAIGVVGVLLVVWGVRRR